MLRTAPPDICYAEILMRLSYLVMLCSNNQSVSVFRCNEYISAWTVFKYKISSDQLEAMLINSHLLASI